MNDPAEMVLEIREANTCIRGCCRSQTVPLHLPPSAYSLSTPIARGAESVVYHAILNGQKTAVKKPVLSTSHDIDNFHKQLQLLCKLDHSGIAKLLAAHARPPNYMFFFEFYEGGSLADKLHMEEWTPTIDEALHIMCKLAKALQYLHNLGIVHRDVKPANILLEGNCNPHLADFGLAEYKSELKQITVETWRSSGKPTGGFHKKNMVGTLIYMAPEVLKKEIHTEKSDVYSFGISLNELLTGVVPYTDLRAEAQAHTVLEMKYTEQLLTASVVSDKLRPNLADLGSGAPSCLPLLIQKCWDADPSERPCFDDIIVALETMIEQVTKGKGERRITETAMFGDLNPTSFRSFEENINWFTQGESFLKGASLSPCSGVKKWLDRQDICVTYFPVLSFGSFSTCGGRETMEDTHFLMPQMCNEKEIHLFGVFDGHRGAAAAEYSVKVLPGILQSLGSLYSPSSALVEAFVQTDVAFRNELVSHRRPKGVVKKDFHPGCTAIAALLVKNRLYVASAGDCRTILCRAGCPIALSRDHVASCVDERERILKAGGQVQWQVDTWRVGSAALQVTRSIGDDDLKPAVTAEPEITDTEISIDDEYLVMASDGLWDVLSDEDVVSIIRDTVKEPGMCSKRLATEAAARGSKDNITVIIVFLRPVSTAERIF